MCQPTNWHTLLLLDCDLVTQTFVLQVQDEKHCCADYTMSYAAFGISVKMWFCPGDVCNGSSVAYVSTDGIKSVKPK